MLRLHEGIAPHPPYGHPLPGERGKSTPRCETGMNAYVGQDPIIYGLSDTTSEAQRVAVSIGDWIGGCVDTTTSVCHGPSGIAFQDVGEVTCTLGEIKNRGDLIIFWGSNPAESHPRHFTKYSLMPKGTFVPRGRKDRYCVMVDVRKTKSAKAADLFIQIKPRKDFEALWALPPWPRGSSSTPPSSKPRPAFPSPPGRGSWSG